MMTFRLTKKAEVCVICGQSPSLSELENEVGQTFTVSLVCLLCHCLNCEYALKSKETNSICLLLVCIFCQVSGFLRVLWFLPPINLTATI